MFLTWQLWNALRFPMRRHPIFNHARTPSDSSDVPSPFWRWLGRIALVCVILFAMMFPVPTLMTSIGFAIGLPLLLILFNGTALGIILVTGISKTIASAQKSTRFELMSVSAEGALGVSWLLATGTIHRRNWLKVIYRLVKWVVMLVLVLLALAIFMLLLGTITSESELLRQQQLNVLRDVINMSLLVAVLWLDHVQSIVIAIVLGIVLPTIIRVEVQLASMATMIYLIIQCCTYLAIFVVYRLIDIILSGLWGDMFIISIAVTFISIMTFYLTREAIIGVLWRIMLNKYDASIEEYEAVVNV